VFAKLGRGDLQVLGGNLNIGEVGGGVQNRLLATPHPRPQNHQNLPQAQHLFNCDFPRISGAF
jgi:hypothetical protein